MVNEPVQNIKLMAFGFFLKSYKDLKRFNVKTLLPSAQEFFCTGSTLLPQVEVCFHFTVASRPFQNQSLLRQLE